MDALMYCTCTTLSAGWESSHKHLSPPEMEAARTSGSSRLLHERVNVKLI